MDSLQNNSKNSYSPKKEAAGRPLYLFKSENHLLFLLLLPRLAAITTVAADAANRIAHNHI